MEENDFERADAVAEEFALYLKTVTQPHASWGDLPSFSVREFFSDKMLLVRAIRKGIPQHLFISLKSMLPFSDEEWADFLDISLKSLQRYKKDESHLFKSIHSEKILELTEVIAAGREVFDSQEKFSLWLDTPSFALGGMKPIELIKDSYGKEMVLSEIQRIDQGIFV
ncbi:type II RES/Xre toxin-antitoxin system antitoxin [Algoriphagus namhaensis]